MDKNELNYDGSWRMIRRHLLQWANDFQVSLTLLTRLPWPWKKSLQTNPHGLTGVSSRKSQDDLDIPEDVLESEETYYINSDEHSEQPTVGRAVRAFPLVGIVIGLIAGIVFAICCGLGLPSLVSALITVAVSALLTGALHEDGLADTADGFGGGRSKAEKLKLMKDSRIGAYGVLTLLLIVAAKVIIIADFDTVGETICALIAAAAVSRAAMPALMYWLPIARPNGLSASFGKPNKQYVLIGIIISSIVAIILLSWTGIIAIIAAIGATFIVASISKRQIGGQTGDVLGATQQISELFFLLALAVVR
ncbi:MAG: adenosylcobinamide-GDP ribazoletransferase [Alphaproteobacteria bacterium]|nr:adenosylcobinamide-GDP ribazoletransferase [Alphaproteobacteria bacterium]|tara:strand:- start:490 stop:1413 length:924 start_codon:yes stop_codon:yes gene_type:complete